MAFLDGGAAAAGAAGEVPDPGAGADRGGWAGAGAGAGVGAATGAGVGTGAGAGAGAVALLRVLGGGPERVSAVSNALPKRSSTNAVSGAGAAVAGVAGTTEAAGRGRATPLGTASLAPAGAAAAEAGAAAAASGAVSSAGATAAGFFVGGRRPVTRGRDSWMCSRFSESAGSEGEGEGGGRR